jgi:glycosyltransferase involved in cell wall biosynthesis
MRILLVCPHFPPRSIGGVEIYTKRLADTLRMQGDEPAVICVEDAVFPHEGIPVSLDMASGYPVHRVAANLTETPGGLGVTYHSAELERAVGEVMDADRPDVLHLHSGYLLGGSVLLAAQARSIPTVVTLHDFWFMCSRITLSHPGGALCTGPESDGKCAWCLSTAKRRYRLLDVTSGGRVGRVMARLIEHRPIGRALGFATLRDTLAQRRSTLTRALGGADVILSPSHFVRDAMLRAGIGPERIAISRYGIDARPLPRVPRAPGEPLRLGYLGQLAPHKGVHVLVAAVGSMTEQSIRLSVYGDPGPHARYAAELRSGAKKDARIAFEGPYGHERVYDILSRLDTIVVPSIWYENAPFVIQEAQAAGVPVLASHLGGMRELVADERDGLLFEPGSARSLAAQIRRLVHEPDLLERLRAHPAVVRSAADELVELRRHYQDLARRTTKAAHPDKSLLTSRQNSSDY